jgi:hypothetical protein
MTDNTETSGIQPADLRDQDLVGKECVLLERPMGTAVRVLEIVHKTDGCTVKVESIVPYDFMTASRRRRNGSYVEKWLDWSVTTDIPGISTINGTRGRRYSKIYLYISIANVFGTRLIFSPELVEKVKNKDPFGWDEYLDEAFRGGDEKAERDAESG